MQFTSVLAVLSLAFAASANPINIEERTGTPAPSNPCSNTATAKCCNTKKGPLGGILPIQVGDCNNINIIGVLPLSSQCSPNQVVACCPNSGTQTGLVNVGPVCAPVTL
ncbi:MAG: hypothetical protein HETSPECPRED_007688 [Heterodermia speciosa]|uniref:Hydrophobin n=1 Tax=Heterodermia speciosa TaxID=116794 RepID=A0A8H3FU10_9LECA|nr:MAG: hypothetical protein HETSPECPRED_007688 [Heterodermia speciosa]